MEKVHELIKLSLLNVKKLSWDKLARCHKSAAAIERWGQNVKNILEEEIRRRDRH